MKNPKINQKIDGKLSENCAGGTWDKESNTN